MSVRTNIYPNDEKSHDQGVAITVLNDIALL